MSNETVTKLWMGGSRTLAGTSDDEAEELAGCRLYNRLDHNRKQCIKIDSAPILLFSRSSFAAGNLTQDHVPWH